MLFTISSLHSSIAQSHVAPARLGPVETNLEDSGSHMCQCMRLFRLETEREQRLRDGAGNIANVLGSPAPLIVIK